MKPKPIWMAVVTDAMEISEVVNELDYQVNGTTTAAGILDTEITGYEVLDSKELNRKKGPIYGKENR